MALIVKTDNPDELLRKIKKEIQNENIDTWFVDEDGDFTHAPEQWNCKAWMHKISDSSEDSLIFGIVGNKQEKMTKSLYAVYHGRFSEMLLSHFDDEIDRVEITSGKTVYDLF